MEADSASDCGVRPTNRNHQSEAIAVSVPNTNRDKSIACRDKQRHDSQGLACMLGI